MSISQRAADDAGDGNHLERSRKVWDRWSDRYGRSERDFAPLLDDAVERLDLESGDSVLEIGCGPGTNFERLTELVGPDGEILAIDYSPKMVERARERVAEHGWEHVEVRQADASSVVVREETTESASGSDRRERHASSVDLEADRFDAALASLSMSVMPDATAAASRVADAVVPGGRFVVFDLRCIPSGPLRIVNPLLAAFYRWYANWNADEDVLASLRATFDDVVVEETYAAGAAYRAVARTDTAPRIK